MWDRLNKLQSDNGARRIVDLMSDTRMARFSQETDGLLFDFSKTNIDEETLGVLVDLARDCQIEDRRDAMFAGDVINETEGREVLHTALRKSDGPLFVEGADVIAAVHATYARMAEFSDALRSGAFNGQGGKITDVVNIGIGGSDLGPAMGVLAMAAYHDGPRVHFVSNVDGAQISDVLQSLDATTTLVIVASKTFTTIETMTNAATAKAWMAEKVHDTGAQFAALSSAQEKAGEFGISPERVFGFEDWVGGRYSIWGPVGLGMMIAIGADDFKQFLLGAAAMDTHFCTAALDRNLPVLLALVGVWHHQICGYATRAVLPYEQRLSRLPAYLQQLEMESNGKGVAMDGRDLEHGSGPIVWGEPGTNGQHAFYQLIHQGTEIVPCEFMIGAQGQEDHLAHQHALLVANCLAQSEALMKGRPLEQAIVLMEKKGLEGAELERQARHRVFKGNRPSTTLAYQKLTPFVFGQVLALYEHRVFVEGVILGLNSFDQWGVELGKELATDLFPVVTGARSAVGKDPSTKGLIDFMRRLET